MSRLLFYQVEPGLPMKMRLANGHSAPGKECRPDIWETGLLQAQGWLVHRA